MATTEEYVINATLPSNGFAGILPGEIYERRLFTDHELFKVLLLEWRIVGGRILDEAHKDVAIVKFIARRVRQ